MRAGEIINIIEEFAPCHFQEEWDNSGLMVGDPAREITSVLLALDCTLDVVDEALDSGVEMIITHHPLIFKGIKKIGTKSLQDRMLTKIIKNDLVVYSVHTNIDKVPDGVSGIMADKLGLVNREILGKIEEEGVGLGIFGELKEEMSADDFVTFVKERFSLSLIKTSKPLSCPIKKVALCGGSGGSLITDAFNTGAQVYISGDLSYHSYFCEDGFMIIDIGHYESEIGVLDLLMSVILKKIPNFAVLRSKRSKNPIYYR
jgi:dinuclear metal center YbgI/SA1388 family protein